MDLYTSRARQDIRETLALVPEFHNLPANEQIDFYRHAVSARRDQLARGPQAAEGSALALAMGDTKRASDLINDKRHENKRIEQVGDLAGDFMDAVDFPSFVRDLLKAVFDANLEVTLKQMEAYATLLKAATSSLTSFASKIKPQDAFGYLADKEPDNFSLSFPDDEGGQPTLTDKEGNKLDVGDNEIKAKIMDATLAMAREQRALLRETILMGITRLVVEKGVVKAAVVFDIKASERIQKQDKASVQDSRSSSHSVQASGGIFGSIFGGPSGGSTFSSRHAEISVSSAKSEASTDLAAKVTGSVEINFKSDYFKLDNFLAMYGPIPGAAAPGGAPGAPGAPGPALVGAGGPQPAQPAQPVRA